MQSYTSSIEPELARRLARIRLLILDIDGVLTDGGLLVSDSGEEIKRFHSRDGHGIRMLANSGVKIAVITGRSSKVVAHRCAELGIEQVYQGRRDKRPAFDDLCAELNIAPEDCAYMGDDVVDLPVMTRVGAALTVADAHPMVLSRAHWCSRFGGGRGAAREACELLLLARGKLEAALEKYLE